MHEQNLEDHAGREPSRHVNALINMLDAQIRSHQSLRSCLQRKREAIRTADIGVMTAVCREEQALAGRINEVEQQRLLLVGTLTRMIEPDAETPLTLRQIARAVDEPVRAGLDERAATLRAEIEAIRRESSIVTAAAQTLSRHMAGIMQTVYGALSRVRVYERGGRLAIGSQIENCIDLKS